MVPASATIFCSSSPVQRNDLQTLLAHLREIIGVLDRGLEGAPQRLHTIRRYAGRCQRHLADLGSVGDNAEDLNLLGRAAELDRERHVRKLRMPAQAVLDENVDLLVPDPILVRGLHAINAGRVTLDLAALHRQHGGDRSGVAHHDLEFHAEHIVQHRRIDGRRAAAAGAAEDRLAREGILDRLHRRIGVHEGDVDRRRHAPDPVELRGLEQGALGAERLLQRNCRRQQADDRAVPRRDVEYVVRRDQAAAARHVAGDHIRLTWNVFADVAGHGPRVAVIGAGSRIADHHRDGLAAVEFFDGLRPCARPAAES